MKYWSSLNVSFSCSSSTKPNPKGQAEKIDLSLRSPAQSAAVKSQRAQTQWVHIIFEVPKNIFTG
jgi:hypothetical protein